MYNDGEIKITMNIEKATQKIELININQDNKLLVNGKEYELSLTNVIEQGTIRYINKSNNNVCTINENKIIGTSVGKCVIQAIISETKNYKESVSNEITITVNDTPQDYIDINFETLFYNSSTTINVVGGNPNGNVIISTDSDNCTISGNIVYGKTAGKCLLNVTKLGNNIINPITKSILINVNKIKQNLTLNQ